MLMLFTPSVISSISFDLTLTLTGAFVCVIWEEYSGIVKILANIYQLINGGKIKFIKIDQAKSPRSIGYRFASAAEKVEDGRVLFVTFTEVLLEKRERV